jgi:hypothetical protein
MILTDCLWRNTIQIIVISLAAAACGNDAEGLDAWVGFDMGSLFPFASTVSICFDLAAANTVYAVYVLVKEVDARDVGNVRPDFRCIIKLNSCEPYEIRTCVQCPSYYSMCIG